jgi:hypothetical protein
MTKFLFIVVPRSRSPSVRAGRGIKTRAPSIFDGVLF